MISVEADELLKTVDREVGRVMSFDSPAWAVNEELWWQEREPDPVWETVSEHVLR